MGLIGTAPGQHRGANGGLLSPSRHQQDGDAAEEAGQRSGERRPAGRGRGAARPRWGAATGGRGGPGTERLAVDAGERETK